MDFEFRIEQKEAFRVVGVKTSTTTEGNECMRDIPALWGQLIQQGKHLQIMELMNQPPYGLMGINIYNTNEDNERKLDYMVACSSDKSAPEGMSEYVVPPATWAVFPCSRNETSAVEVYIINLWEPASGFELVNSGYATGQMRSEAPDLEVYGENDEAEVWVAVRKKQDRR